MGRDVLLDERLAARHRPAVLAGHRGRAGEMETG